MTSLSPEGRDSAQPAESADRTEQKPQTNKPSRPHHRRNWNRKPGAYRKKRTTTEAAATAPSVPPIEELPEVKEEGETPRRPDHRSRPSHRRSRPEKKSADVEQVTLPQPVVEREEQALARSLNRAAGPISPKALKFPGLNTTTAKQEILSSIKTIFEESGLEAIHLALSGGLDSAVTAGLTAEAVGRKHLRLIHFIENERPIMEKSQAELIAKYLGTPLMVHDCRGQVQSHMDSLKTTSFNVRHRLLCRERMTALVTTAEHERSLVISGINKTKWMLGLTVPHGDMAGVLNPIGDLYHSQLIELAKAINVPKVVLDNAEKSLVLPKQAGVDELTITWKEADFYLYQMLDVKLSLAYLMSLEIDEDKIKALYQRLRASALQRQGLIITDLSKAYQERNGQG